MRQDLEDVFDRDGLWVPPNWRLENWEKQPLHIRQKWSEDRRKDHAVKLERADKKAKRVQRPYPPRYTTQAAIDWGRRQGWKLVEREGYDYRLKRHHDCMFGMDAIMCLPTGELIGVQGAGVGERAAHRRRFDSYGLGPHGAELARARNYRIFYCEFIRNDPEPVLKEQWA